MRKKKLYDMLEQIRIDLHAVADELNAVDKTMRTRLLLSANTIVDVMDQLEKDENK